MLSVATELVNKLDRILLCGLVAPQPVIRSSEAVLTLVSLLAADLRPGLSQSKSPFLARPSSGVDHFSVLLGINCKSLHIVPGCGSPQAQTPGALRRLLPAMAETVTSSLQLDALP